MNEPPSYEDQLANVPSKLSLLTRLFRHAKPWVSSEATSPTTSRPIFGIQWSILLGRKPSSEVEANPASPSDSQRNTK